MAAARMRIGILYSGRSAEHEVSLMSARNVFAGLDPTRYDVVPILVARDGRWLLRDLAAIDAPAGANETGLALVPGGRGRMIALPPTGEPREASPLDALFPVLHGIHGEDGSVQGLAQVAQVPLIGCGIAGSANALDKDLAKRLFTAAGLPAARSRTLLPDAMPDFDTLVAELGLPIFVKPARQGSSVGVSKVTSAADYAEALAEGFRHDSKLLAEEFIDGREIECAVLETLEGTLFVSRPGEIVPAASHGFYSYDAKYIDADGAALAVPADLPADIEAAVRRHAAEAFRALGCDGMARADFFLTADGRILVNELNTIPGFTDISMYSKVMAASGIGYADLLERLIAHGLERARRSESS